jgi:hypothetical protein
MTEVLNHRPATSPESFSDEEAPLFDMADFEADVQEPKPELSPTATRIRAAAERAATFLEDRAETRLKKTDQDEAYDSYSENISTTRNRIREERIDAVEEKIENAKTRISGFGRTTLGRLKNAGLITVVVPSLMASEAGVRGVKRGGEAVGNVVIGGLQKVETGMDTVGSKIVDAKAGAKERYQTYQFNRETKTNQKQFQKEYAKEVKAFDKNAEKQSKLQAKVDKVESKAAAREDRRFEREMRKKVALERRAERRARWVAKGNAVKDMAIGSAEAVKETYSSAADRAKELAESAKQKGRVSRTAGRMALQTYRDTKEAFKSN